MDKDVGKVNKVISKSAIGAWRMAVTSTPKPPSPAKQKYKRTGRLRNAWKLRTRKYGLIPAMGVYKGDPNTPHFNFNILKDKYFVIFNNVPYAPFVEEGINVPIPYKMLHKAKIYFDNRIKRDLK
jgi:hypothetical protein